MTHERYYEREKPSQVWSFAIRNKDKIQRKGELQPMLVAGELYMAGEKR